MQSNLVCHLLYPFYLKYIISIEIANKMSLLHVGHLSKCDIIIGLFQIDNCGISSFSLLKYLFWADWAAHGKKVFLQMIFFKSFVVKILSSSERKMFGIRALRDYYFFFPPTTCSAAAVSWAECMNTFPCRQSESVKSMCETFF